MLAHLLALNAEVGGTLLRNVSRGALRPRWTMTLEALQSVSPQWFRDHQAQDKDRVQLVDHDERIERLERITDLHTAALTKRVA